MIGNTNSLVGDEAEWTAEGPDLAALGRGPEYGWLNTLLEDILSKISEKATLVSKVKEALSHTCPNSESEPGQLSKESSIHAPLDLYFLDQLSMSSQRICHNEWSISSID